MSPEQEREIYLYEAASKLARLLHEIDEKLYIILDDGTLKLRANDRDYGRTVTIRGPE